MPCHPNLVPSAFYTIPIFLSKFIYLYMIKLSMLYVDGRLLTRAESRDEGMRKTGYDIRYMCIVHVV